MDNKQNNPLSAKRIVMFVVYGIVAVCLLFTVLSFNDLPGIMNQLKTVDGRYVILAMLMVFIYMALYPLSLCILAKVRKCEVKTSITYSIAMTEHFFNGITPLATGGQPFQAHSFSRAKIKISESTGLLLTNLLIYMIVTTGFSLTGLIFFDRLTLAIDPWWFPIIAIGYTLNFMVLVADFFLGTSKRVRGWLTKFIFFLCKFRIFKWLRPKSQGIKEYFEQVQESFHDLTKKKGYFALALLTKILSFAFLYSSSFFILMAMHIPVTITELFLIISGTSFAITAVGFIPTPGASGVVEGSAGQVFKSLIIFVSGGTIVASTAMLKANGVMLIWRLLSYYFVMAVSLAFYVGLEIYFSKKSRTLRKQEKENSDPQTEDTQNTEKTD